jgi:hypothetical protein
MHQKMTILRACVGLLLATACASRSADTRQGDPAPSFAGSYETEEFLYASVCTGVKARAERFRVTVEQSPGSESIRLKWDDQSYEAKVRKDRSFDSKETAIERSGVPYASKIGGHFTDTSFYARIDMRRKGFQLCYYQLRWAGAKR